MTEEDKEKKRLLNLSISSKLNNVLERLSIATSQEHDDEDDLDD